MRDLIVSAFPICTDNNCLDVENSNLFQIFDHPTEQRCYIHKAETPLSYPYFTVHNPTKKNVHFLAIDNCILFAEDGRKCDFAIYDNTKFFFVEVKRGLGTYGRQRKADAVVQLRNTLTYFKNNLHFGRYNIFACICVGYNRPAPAAAASDLNLMVDFMNRYDTELVEGNEVNF